jgi:hypothetical protein
VLEGRSNECEDWKVKARTCKKKEARRVLEVVHGRDFDVRDQVIKFAYIFQSVSSFIFVVYPSEHPNGMFRWVHNKSELCNNFPLNI